jgi:radical SAM protein with 4Fe4S-binding SPASM domain
MGALEHKPYLVSWNITRRCNLACPHCYIDASQTNCQEISTDQAKAVIQSLYLLNQELMLVFSGGEPMLRHDVYELVELASSKGFITVMGSNGTVLTQDKLRRLKSAGLMGVGISIDSTKPERHDLFRGMDGAWNLSTKALAYAKEQGIDTQIDVTLTDENWGEIDDFVELGAECGARAVNFFFLVCTGRAARTHISVANYDLAIRRIAQIMMAERRLMVRARCAPHIYRILYENGFPLTEGTKGCIAGTSYMRIDPEGYVTPCPYMPLAVGNVRTDTLQGLWENSQELKLLRSGVYKGRCGRCEYSEVCGGCRARAFMEKNDLLEDDTLCAYEPKNNGKIHLSEIFPGSFVWNEDARERIKRVPLFMKNVVVKIIERKAQERGISQITSELIDELKERRC